MESGTSRGGSGGPTHSLTLCCASVMSGRQWLALAPWGRRYLGALREYELGLRSERPREPDFRPRVTIGHRTTLPGDSTGVRKR